ncbi:hypothetical protein VUJ46_18845 [Chryseobacterium sp. MYb264]|uniref:hypothetical protein n=1 Tax=Chryseobacterium sp. MYb264 TaxID=2745153 RepID=UPI002E0ECDDF|nr:hypothetical protein VUJ46_18845 [Chryseobacterium sp. MYb264]
MADLKISGETNPEIGKEIIYSISPVDFGNTISHPTSPISITPVHWEIYVLEKSRWRKTGQNTKTGDTVTYNFNQKSLVREGIKIVVTRGNDYGELQVKTKRAGKPKVTKIDLLDRNYQKITKSLNYMDTIIARAYCNEMEGETVFFTLWEDDAAGSGHDKINEINKINMIPLRQTVKDGEAEVAFNLPLYTQAARIADMQVAKGDKNEGKNHEYYVTVDYYGKMVGESKNVNILNPNYDNPIQRAIEQKYPEKFPPKPKEPHKRPVPAPEKPKKDAFKTPVTERAKTKAADPKGKILSAHFVTLGQQPLKDLQLNVPFYAKIRSQGMKGKTIKLTLFEDDAAFDDPVYEKYVTISSDVSLHQIKIDEKMYEAGGDLFDQQYYIEIRYTSETVNSSVLNLRDDALRTKIETKPSTVGVKKQEQKKQEDNKVCECEAKVRAFIRMLRVGEGASGEVGYTRLFSKKNFTKPPYNKDMSSHPKITIVANGYSSTAAGAYQIMEDTYKGFQGYYMDQNKKWHYSEKLNYIKKYSITSFNQESQDKLCIIILKHNYVQKRSNKFFHDKNGKPIPSRQKFNDAYGDIIKLIIDDNWDKALLISSLCWASLPDAPYGQPSETKQACKLNYEKFLKEELDGKSDLHLKKGFLKEFEYYCCDEEPIKPKIDEVSNGKWHDPVNNPICTIFTQSQTNGIVNYAGKHWGLFGLNARNGTRPHKGLDLFAIPGSSVYACVKAEVTNIIYPATAGYGISLTLKILDKKTFLEHKRNYELKYPQKESKQDSGYNEDGDIYLFYGHLRKVLVKKGDIIEDISKPVALSGTSGVQSGGTCAPHVHFEIRDSQKRRCNPGYYINYKSFDDQSSEEINIQIKTAKNGKINEFNGKN